MYQGQDGQETGQTLTCCDCQQPFLFSEGELRFYQSKNLSIPKRCKTCRAAKKQKMAGGTTIPQHSPQNRVEVQVDDALSGEDLQV